MSRHLHPGFRLYRLLAGVVSIAGLCGLALPASMADEAFRNFAGMIFVDIPAGSFMMGACPADDDTGAASHPHCTLNLDADADDVEVPPHPVRIARFQIGKHEVTLGQFRQFLQQRSDQSLLREEGFVRSNQQGDHAPVVWVSWHDAQAFIDWLNASKPESDRGTYRLPAEAEWEYACRAGKSHKYCGGDQPDKVAWYQENSDERQQAVGTRKANAFGVHDMSGNVHEWVADCWHPNYFDAPADGQVWAGGDCTTRILRGGSWGDLALATRTTFRSNLPPETRYIDFGFRVVRELP